ncbi:glycosyltransferase family 25 protein [Photobacterium sp.]|uniref:glycosyltransferase family 25 protein n=1 Tax=Photobacterium sp. TaxID=660 RepID=UPI00299D19F9|nr:glycosyltransferase family 25 protein [Photobacterium sp.]MDX1302646.1 glycosyltransferase family 25 protein [Photobacterium sp.]
MEAFVISLADNLRRRKKVTDTLDKHHINFNFIDGVDGRKGNHPYLERYNEKEFLFNYGRKAAPGEIGCYASHMLAWQKCVDLNQSILVFEDDLSIKDGVLEAFSACEKLIDKYGFIRMETTNKKPQYKVATVDGMTLSNFLKVPQCATCYAISPATAKAFLDNSQELCLPVDVFIRNVWMHKQAIYGLEPYFVSASGEDSIIGKRNRSQKKSISTRVICLAYKLRNMAGNFISQISFYLSR